MRPRVILAGPPAHDPILAERAQIMADIRRLEQFMDQCTAMCCRVQADMQAQVRDLDAAIRARDSGDRLLDAHARRPAKGRKVA